MYFNPSSERPLAILRECPVYKPTPLLAFDSTHENWDTAFSFGKLFVKDEGQRMNLGSFKALGGIFAITQLILDASGASSLDDPRARATAADITFVTASAGNHGISVATGARLFGANAVIVLSEQVPESFAERIRQTGAQVERSQGDYEDSVAHAMKLADENNWLHLADGSWPGYIERPALIVEGYTVLAEECREYFETREEWPTHIYVQAGVGAMAAAITGHVRTYWAEQPEIYIVEPEAAPCLARSVEAGELTHTPGPVSTMGRLDCKNASLIAFDCVKDRVDGFVTISEEQGESIVGTFSHLGVHTTPSGGAGLAAALIDHNLNADSRVLVIASECGE